MKIKHLTVVFNAPTFLGDATQSGRWRTPPFKAQLRQWWRIAYASSMRFLVNVQEMRDIEGHLFGHAWLENDTDDNHQKIAARKSEVRLRLSRWDQGQDKQWLTQDPPIRHPNVHGRDGKEKPVGAHLYMGYGPLTFQQGTALKANAAIQAKESAELALAYPDKHAPLIEQALLLMNAYGTVGGRSRNGWGSYSIGDAQSSSPSATQSLEGCLRHDWPHAIGSDDNGALIWKTNAHKDWASLMKTLANIKIGLRTNFIFTTGKNTPAPEDRHWLSYPVTNHSVSSWDGNARLPNQLRFKIRPTADGQLEGVVFHMPHLPPTSFRADPRRLLSVWQQVHQHLDQHAAQPLTRIAA
jgi:CRISPR-associated protein Cmr1